MAEASILLLDEEREFVAAFARRLRALGCRHVQTAFGGSRALELTRSSHFDLLIGKSPMAGVDGVSVLHRLGELGKSIPSLLLVSENAPVDKKELYALGVEAFLTGALPMKKLRDSVDKAIADRSALWGTPMQRVPQQSLVIHARDKVEASGPRGFCLGRGGFSVPYKGTLSVGKVAFRCIIEPENGVISGHGWVRWRSKKEQMAGVEIAYLEDTCREWVQAKIEELKPHSYIPS